MDIISLNKLANMEHKQWVQSLPRVEEYSKLNITTEPGWLLRPFVWLMAALKQLQSAQPAAQDCAPDCPPTLTRNPAGR